MLVVDSLDFPRLQLRPIESDPIIYDRKVVGFEDFPRLLF